MDVNTIFLSLAGALVLLVVWMIRTATNAATAQGMINARFAQLEKTNAALETEVKDLRTSDTSGKETIKAQQGQINALEKQVSELKAAGQISRNDILERDREIARLNSELQRVLAAAMPPGMVQVAPQLMTPIAPSVVPNAAIAATAGTPANPLQMEIVNKDENPVPVIEQPKAPPDNHDAANAEHTARIAAELSKRTGIVPPPSEEGAP